MPAWTVKLALGGLCTKMKRLYCCLVCVKQQKNNLCSVASTGASLAANFINQTGIAAAVGGPLASIVEGFIQNG